MRILHAVIHRLYTRVNKRVGEVHHHEPWSHQSSAVDSTNSAVEAQQQTMQPGSFMTAAYELHNRKTTVRQQEAVAVRCFQIRNAVDNGPCRASTWTTAPDWDLHCPT